MDPNVDSLLWNGRSRDSYGSEKVYGVVPAIVVKISDDKEARHLMGAVQVRFPWLLDEGAIQDVLPWARCVTFASGKDGDGAECGWVATPQIGDEVLIGFENGDLHRPYVLGQLWNPKAGEAPKPGGGGAAGGGGGAGGGAGAEGGGGAKQDAGGAPDGKKDAGPKQDEPKKDAQKKDDPKADGQKDQPKADAKKDARDEANKDEPAAPPGKDAPKADARDEQGKQDVKKDEAALKDAPKDDPKKDEPKKDERPDLIKKGETLSPPRGDDAEAKWYERLEETTDAELQPGDVLLRKVYGVFHKIKQAQDGFLNHGKGSNCSIHAMLYLGGGQVVDAADAGVTIRARPDTSIIAWRATDPRQAQKAVEIGRWLASKNIDYSIKSCFFTGPRSSDWGPLAQARANQIASRQVPTDEMMCSELVSYCYQGIRGNPWVKLDAMRVSPLRLEDYMNSNPSRFKFAGRIKRTGPEQLAAFDRFVNNLFDAADKVEEVVDDVIDKAGEVAGDVVDAVADVAGDVADKAEEVVGDAADAVGDFFGF